MDLRHDDRGLAVAIVAFFAMIIVGALLFILFNEALGELFITTTDQAQTTGGVEQINLAETIWDNILAYVLFISVLFLIARAVVESRGPA